VTDHYGRLRNGMAALFIAPIRLYRLLISPMLPPSCRFTPSCSQYAIRAIQIHGPLKGPALALRRLSRCHPITWLGGSQGYDPVPPR
jgi:putative membrane protein insertion efficiency factor